MAKIVAWTLSELAELFNQRRKNQYDCNVLVTGLTGKGKSTVILKLLNRFEGFKPFKHQVYSREDTIMLLRNQKFSFCWNDELIEVGYKREHWNKLQIELIKTLTQYRCNWNIFAGALPVFFTLDKELQKLFAINIDVTKRGEAVVHMRLAGRRYSDDFWDVKHNAKLEEKWSKIRQINPKFTIPYHKYSTFVGYLYWNDITEKQRKRYEEIRDIKKRKMEEDKMSDEEKSKPFYEKLFDMLIKKELNRGTFEKICIIGNKKIANARATLNKELKNKGIKERVNDLLKIEMEDLPESNQEILKELEDI